MRSRPATSASTSAWPPRWHLFRSAAGRIASSVTCTARERTQWISSRKRRLWWNAGRRSGRGVILKTPQGCFGGRAGHPSAGAAAPHIAGRACGRIRVSPGGRHPIDQVDIRPDPVDLRLDIQITGSGGNESLGDRADGLDHVEPLCLGLQGMPGPFQLADGASLPMETYKSP